MYVHYVFWLQLEPIECCFDSQVHVLLLETLSIPYRVQSTTCSASLTTTRRCHMYCTSIPPYLFTCPCTCAAAKAEISGTPVGEKEEDKRESSDTLRIIV